MSIEHVAVVLHHSKAKGTAKLILLGIANHQGDGGAWPAVSTLAAYGNVTERNVQKAIAQLVGKGELRVHVQAGGLVDHADHTRPNRYDVLVSCPPWCDRTPNHRDTRHLAGRQPGLWINRVSNSTGGVGSDRGGVSHSTPGGVSHTTPKPSIEPATTQVGTSTTERARDEVVWDSRPCNECDQPQSRCYLAQQAVPPAERHTYKARDVHASR